MWSDETINGEKAVGVTELLVGLEMQAGLDTLAVLLTQVAATGREGESGVRGEAEGVMVRSVPAPSLFCFC